ncbi:PLAC8-like protein 1 isoform 2-T2 [Menidia menidia]
MSKCLVRFILQYWLYSFFLSFRTEEIPILIETIGSSFSAADVLRRRAPRQGKGKHFGPMAEKELTDWNSGLFDCFEDMKICCYGFWCMPCLACTVSRKFGEHQCLPLYDVCGSALLVMFGIPMIVPPAALSMRAAMRTKYGIKGSLCEDVPISCFCVGCSWCQMYREVKHREKDPVVINLVNQTVVSMQPTQAAGMQHHPSVDMHQASAVNMQAAAVNMQASAVNMQNSDVMMVPTSPPPAGFKTQDGVFMISN